MVTRAAEASKSIAVKINKSALARLAVQVRKELGLGEFDRFDPYALAEMYGVAVHPLDGLAATGCPTVSLEFFGVQRPEAWSAALVPDGTGQFIVENTAHQPTRRRSNIIHEMAHVVLEHTCYSSALCGSFASNQARVSDRRLPVCAAPWSGRRSWLGKRRYSSCG
jgi:IrrE N-terminal-like domain